MFDFMPKKELEAGKKNGILLKITVKGTVTVLV